MHLSHAAPLDAIRRLDARSRGDVGETEGEAAGNVRNVAK
jgi:hypothetical protein